jgi:aryl-alcohol dehydrogenase-like predicted oxidoreductase
MLTRRPGPGGEPVAAIGLGCMGLVGWYGARDDAEAKATVLRALELGVTHLDTAAVYQNGENERFVGECIRGRRREVFLATKCGLGRTADGGIGVDTRPATIRASCDASLARLGVEQIDLFYLHRIDPAVPLEDAVGTMAELQTTGKIRHIGVSEASAATLRRAHALAPIGALQSELSPWTRSASREALDVCQALGIAFVAYSPLGRGFLTGSISSLAELPADDTRRAFPRFRDVNLERNRGALDRFRKLATRIGCTPAQLSLAWVLAQGPRVLPIPGTKKRRWLEDNARAADLELTPADLAAVEAAIPEEEIGGERYPEAMLGTLNV